MDIQQEFLFPKFRLYFLNPIIHALNVFIYLFMK